MKILISLHCWNKKEEKYLDIIFKNYQKQFNEHQLTYLLTVRNEPNIELPPNTILQYSNKNSLEFLWNNEEYINEHYTEYDYIIHTDSDILITIDNFNHFLQQETILPPDYICGYLVYENVDNKDYLINMPFIISTISKKHIINDKIYITPFNLHSCCYIINTKKYIKSDKCFRWQGYNHNDMAMTRFYKEYTKVVSLDDVFNKKALVLHLSNKYYNNPNIKVPTKEYLQKFY